MIVSKTLLDQALFFLLAFWIKQKLSPDKRAHDDDPQSDVEQTARKHPEP